MHTIDDSSSQVGWTNLVNKYDTARQTWSEIYDEVGLAVEEKLPGARVLDVGCGGLLCYDHRQANEVTLVDISPEMLEKADHLGLQMIVDDARSMANVPDSNYDIIIVNLCLHHICSETVAGNLENLKSVLEACKKKSSATSRIVICEPVLPSALYILQCLLYPLFRKVMKYFRYPCTFFFSMNKLTTNIRATFGTEHATVCVRKVRITGFLDLLGGTIPGMLVVPAFLSPTRFHVFQIDIHKS